MSITSVLVAVGIIAALWVGWFYFLRSRSTEPAPDAAIASRIPQSGSDDLRVENTKLFVLYYHELWWLAHSIKRKAEQLFTEATVPDTGYLIQVNPDLHSLISSLLSDAANLKKLLITRDKPSVGESARQFGFHKARASALSDVVSKVSLVELLNVKVRNTLEHFDQYLDEANLDVSEANTPPSPMAAYNMVLSHWEAFNPRVYPLRVYISSERKFYNIKWSVDMSAVHKEASELLECLSVHPALRGVERPGGLMVPLG